MKLTPESEARFWAGVHKDGPMHADGRQCWIWAKCVNGEKAGYGTFGVNGKTRYAHRISYELLVGPIPEGLTIDHLCRTPRCIRPEHLEPVTRAENNLRGFSAPAMNARRTTCINGHPFTQRLFPKAGKRRICKPCANVRLKALRHRKAEEQANAL